MNGNSKESTVLGVVVSFSNRNAKVRCSDGNILTCSLKGKITDSSFQGYKSPVAGDHVSVIPISKQNGVIESIFERKSELSRYNEKGETKQVLAANIDLVVCIASTRAPPFRARFIDRVGVMAEYCGLPFLIVCNKIDLGLDVSIESRLAAFQKLGYGVVKSSVRDSIGIDELRTSLLGKTSVFIGQSGTGKSSIINCLIPGADQRIAEISDKHKRGKHTTTLSAMVSSSNGDIDIIDTPGIRRLAIRNIEPDDLGFYFPDMVPFLGLCEFGASCTHRYELHCFVKQAVQEGIIHHDRYESYLRMRAELEETRNTKTNESRKPLRSATYKFEDEEW
ncbi:MAG TPA: ribosome small subunit-dependent GTPase A [Rectinema sp.]|nr:MAG: putative ribosome biogenesis GTPase RsgA [Spirochaetes bacterium ADurb.Bin001]HNP92367.1 ribosome small subunit-dependent GTPase A [Rectinema sp.]HOH16024.1 ribosome small subunit-dependent GTPase A [Rectinema sp.]